LRGSRRSERVASHGDGASITHSSGNAANLSLSGPPKLRLVLSKKAGEDATDDLNPVGGIYAPKTVDFGRHRRQPIVKIEETWPPIHQVRAPLLPCDRAKCINQRPDSHSAFLEVSSKPMQPLGTPSDLIREVDAVRGDI
jgi:hypothetical protein